MTFSWANHHFVLAMWLESHHAAAESRVFLRPSLHFRMKRDENFRVKLLWLRSLSSKYKTSVYCPRHKIDLIRTLWMVGLLKSNWRNLPSPGSKLLSHFQSESFKNSTAKSTQTLFFVAVCFVTMQVSNLAKNEKSTTVIFLRENHTYWRNRDQACFRTTLFEIVF